MSIPVELSNLPETLARYGFAYLLTHGAQGAPRALAVRPLLRDGVLHIDGVGERTRAGMQAHPAVGLVWPPSTDGEYSLIVDGNASVFGAQVQVAPTHAVLHRPAPAAKAGS